MLEFKILSENRGNENFNGESGLSIYIEYDDYSFLFDTGYSDLFIKNAEKLNVDLKSIKKVVLSHGHSDHTNGVQFLENGKTIIIHPEGFRARYSIRKKEYAGFPINKDVLTKKHELIATKAPYEFYPNVYFIGEIPMVIPFEAKGNFSTTLDDEYKVVDFTEDDSGIAIKTPLGLVIMVGCGHRGICNAIERAKAIAKEDRIYAVLGGFHLRKLEEQKEVIDATIDYFKQNNISKFYLGHCITDDVIAYFESKMPFASIERLASGKKFSISYDKILVKNK